MGDLLSLSRDGKASSNGREEALRTGLTQTSGISKPRRSTSYLLLNQLRFLCLAKSGHSLGCYRMDVEHVI